MKELTQYLFEIEQVKIFNKFIQFAINHKLTILPQGYDTIK